MTAAIDLPGTVAMAYLRRYPVRPARSNSAADPTAVTTPQIRQTITDRREKV